MWSWILSFGPTFRSANVCNRRGDWTKYQVSNVAATKKQGSGIQELSNDTSVGEWDPSWNSGGEREKVVILSIIIALCGWIKPLARKYIWLILIFILIFRAAATRREVVGSGDPLRGPSRLYMDRIRAQVSHRFSLARHRRRHGGRYKTFKWIGPWGHNHNKNGKNINHMIF